MGLSAEMRFPSSHPVFGYIEKLTSSIVTETGIPSDVYHVGKIILHGLKDAPDYILQIDGATGEMETFRSALERSVRCATAFRNLGLKYQDVIVIMAPNCIDVVIPMYAALYLGIMTAGVYMTLRDNQLQATFKSCAPKIIFSHTDKVRAVEKSLKVLNMSARIVIFGQKEDCSIHLTFAEFLDEYGRDIAVENFRPANFDPAETTALLVSTSGSTGHPKTSALTYKNIILSHPFAMVACTEFPTPVNMALVLSPVQWLSAFMLSIMSPILRFTRLLASVPTSPEHVYYLINKYRPDYVILSPTFLTTLLKPSERMKCDFSSFKYINLSGCALYEKLLKEIKKVNTNVSVIYAYGMTEAGVILNPINVPFGSLGSPLEHFQYKLVDPMTKKEISDPNVRGELWVKGSTVFKGYYNNPEITAAAFDNGWFKTDDLLYRDENHNYYYVDRLKSLLIYKNNQVSPLEIEAVILKHPGVLDVAVIGIPDKECGDLPVAVIIPQDGCTLTEQEIKGLVKESLGDSKQLRGGVIFVKELPTTSTSKLDRQKIKTMAIALTNK